MADHRARLLDRLSALRTSLHSAEGREPALGRRLADVALRRCPQDPEQALPVPANGAAELDWSSMLHTGDEYFADQVTGIALSSELAGELRERVVLALEARLVNAARAQDSHSLAVLLRAALVAGAGETATIRQGIGLLVTAPPPAATGADGTAATVQHVWALAEAWRPGTTRSALRPCGARPRG